MEHGKVSREELARVAVHDLLAAVPTLQAISTLRSMVVLDEPDEYRIDFMFDIIVAQSMVMLSTLSLIESEMEALYAFRENYSQEDYGLGEEFTSSGDS